MPNWKHFSCPLTKLFREVEREREGGKGREEEREGGREREGGYGEREGGIHKGRGRGQETETEKERE